MIRLLPLCNLQPTINHPCRHWRVRRVGDGAGPVVAATIVVATAVVHLALAVPVPAIVAHTLVANWAAGARPLLRARKKRSRWKRQRYGASVTCEAASQLPALYCATEHRHLTSSRLPKHNKGHWRQTPHATCRPSCNGCFSSAALP